MAGLSNHDGVYDGPATLTAAGVDQQVRVRLAGRVDPIDGKYHWQGTVLAADSPDTLAGGLPVTVTIGDRSADGRLAEKTPWGSYSITGVGTALFDVAEFDQ
ncbi:DUF4873 domain-containing protein [Streptomyces sp. NPDC014733]|uniref:DUF4873 domain-containing protein n=1 Tax=Streptomyces sp. NPDC014733 TaxID=3364885 RepID=UPI0037031ECA